MHLSFTKDKSERQNVNRKVNRHIADNFETYYCDKIPLPYTETVGVGSLARQVTCSTREEFVAFLRSEDSLCAFANYQELLAIANMLNIKIYVFTYGIGGVEKSWSWKVVHPDRVMAGHCEFAPGTVPDMYLYNSDNTHYDLLVLDNSRLAVLGLISMEKDKLQEKVVQEKGIQEKGFQEIEDKNVEVKQTKDEWKTVKNGKKNFTPVNYVENNPITQDSEEAILTKQKLSGHKRDGPQNVPLVQNEQNVTVNLEAQMDNLKVSESQCDECQEDFLTKINLKSHMKSHHSKQWNCDQCDFQTSTRTLLMNHCKLVTGHKPSKQRIGQTGVMTCYTCRDEFRSYHELMNHRKEEHPSHKKCRYYLKGECNFSAEDCWYLHENEDKGNIPSHSNAENFQCFVCKDNFMSKHDLMQHKKKNHSSQTLCEKFKQGVCERSAQECHYKHPQTSTKQNTSGQKPNPWAQKLPTVQKDFYQPQHAPAPDQGPLMEALNMLNQRLQALEEKMFPQQI